MHARRELVFRRVIRSSTSPAHGTRSADRLSHGPPSNSTREEAAAKKRSLQCPVAMHSATTKTGDFPSRIQTSYWLIIRLQHPTGEVSFHPSQGFAGENREPYGNQGARSRIEQSVRLRHANQSVSQIRTHSSDGGHLGI